MAEFGAPSRVTYCVGHRSRGGVTILFARVGSDEERARQIAAQLDAADILRGRTPAHTVYAEVEEIPRNALETPQR